MNVTHTAWVEVGNGSVKDIILAMTHASPAIPDNAFMKESECDMVFVDDDLTLIGMRNRIKFEWSTEE